MKSIASAADAEEVRKRFEKVTWKNTKPKAFCPHFKLPFFGPDTSLEPSKHLVAYLPARCEAGRAPAKEAARSGGFYVTNRPAAWRPQFQDCQRFPEITCSEQAPS